MFYTYWTPRSLNTKTLKKQVANMQNILFLLYRTTKESLRQGYHMHMRPEYSIDHIIDYSSSNIVIFDQLCSRTIPLASRFSFWGSFSLFMSAVFLKVGLAESHILYCCTLSCRECTDILENVAYISCSNHECTHAWVCTEIYAWIFSMLDILTKC